MIRYALRCDRGHSFESWFQSSGAYESQRKRKLVACPVCESVAVDKALMAPRLAKKTKAPTPVPPAPPAAAVAAPTEPVALMSAQESELHTRLKELRDYIVAKADNVGKDFPTEARKMHYGESEHRPIYGEASADEARALIEEGIEVAPLPIVPGDRH